VTEEGGPTAHTAIVARALGIPAVVGCEGVLSVPDGATVAVDGATGTVRVDPAEAELADLEAREAQRRAVLARSSGPGRTADGHSVPLLANIGSAADLIGVAGDGAEGVGLFRTELLYLDRATPPTMDEQVARRRLRGPPPAGAWWCVLDAGADKPVRYLNQAAEPNPALRASGWAGASPTPARPARGTLLRPVRRRLGHGAHGGDRGGGGPLPRLLS
jgi:phosphotransferase system enzyme I (PtsI)